MTRRVDYLNVGLTNRCNCRCSFCPVPDSRREKADMGFGLFRKVMDEVLPHLDGHLSLALFGESTLSPILGDCLGYAKDASGGKLRTQLFTNGICLDEETARALAEHGLDRVMFSVDAHDRESYLEIKRVDRFGEVGKNIRRLMKIRGERKKPEVVVQSAALERVPRDLFERAWNGVGDRVKYGTYITWGGRMRWMAPHGRKRRGQRPCWSVFHHLCVASDGEVVLCCMDEGHSVVFGNAKDRDVMGIWNSEEAEDVRERHARGDFSKTPMCLECEKTRYEMRGAERGR